MRVLLIEDDELLGDGVTKSLAAKNYQVDWIKDGQTALQATKGEYFDVIILDIGLPQVSGFTILATIRANGNKTPVLLLTARDSVGDLVKGLDSGADDYLTKPFDLNELFARLRALQRRSTFSLSSTLEYGNISLDTIAQSVKLDNEPIVLSRREFVLLQKLLQNAGRVISREQLLQMLYGWEEHVDSNALEVHIHNLRKKFGNELIKTVRGVGYMIIKEENS